MGGAKIRVIVADTETKPEVAGTQAEKLIADKEILLISGTNQSAATMVATQIAERNRICYLTCVDPAAQITQRKFQYTYRPCPTTTQLAKDFIYFARDMGKATGKIVRKMAILCENSIYGTTMGEAAVKAGKEVGFEVVDFSTYDAVTTKDFTGYISKYKSAAVELLCCNSRPQDAVLITRTMKELNFNPYGYGGMLGGHTVSEFGEVLGKDSDYVIATSFFTDNANIPRIAEFGSRFKKEFNMGMDPTFVTAFANVAILKKALEKTPTYDREKLKSAVDGVELKLGEFNNFQIDGVKWDSNHDNTLARNFVVQWENGNMNAVFPAAYSVKKAIWPRPTWDEIKKR